MTELTGYTPVSAPLSPGADERNTWPTHDNRFGRGGIRFVADEAERNAIPMERRFGLVVIVESFGADAEKRSFKWNGKSVEGNDGSWEDYELSTIQIPASGITIVNPDGSTTTGIEILALDGIELEGNAKDGFTLKVSGGSGGVSVVETDGQKRNYGNITDVKIESPLEAKPDPNNNGAVIIGLKHDAFEPMHKPSFLAYVSGTEVISKSSLPATTEEIKNNAKISFKNIVSPDGMYISANADMDAFTIEEADQGDPNLTGGTNYVIALRADTQMKAPYDGRVLIYLYDDSINPYEPKGYLEDINGNPIVAEKFFRQGELIKDISLAAIVNAKGDKTFTCHAVSDFQEDLNLEGRFSGGSGLLIQAISINNKTGTGLLQYELDTGEKLLVDYTDVHGYQLMFSNRSTEMGKYVSKYEAFIQNTLGNISLRYSFDETDRPVPCGLPMKGNADVELDTTVNQIPSSQIKRGEGAIKFKKDGKASISTSFRLSNDTKDDAVFKPRWCKVSADGNTFTDIPDANAEIPVSAGSVNLEGTIPEFEINVLAGDRIALRAKTDKGQHVFIKTMNDMYPLTETTIDFNELFANP